MECELVLINVDALTLANNDSENYATDAAFEHARAVSDLRGIPVGSDQFIEEYNNILPVYTDAVNHLGYYMYLGLIAANEILENNLLSVRIARGADDEAIDNAIRYVATHIAQCVAAAAIQSLPSPGMVIPSNDDLAAMPENMRAVRFTFCKADHSGDNQ